MGGNIKDGQAQFLIAQSEMLINGIKPLFIFDTKYYYLITATNREILFKYKLKYYIKTIIRINGDEREQMDIISKTEVDKLTINSHGFVNGSKL